MKTLEIRIKKNIGPLPLLNELDRAEARNNPKIRVIEKPTPFGGVKEFAILDDKCAQPI